MVTTGFRFIMGDMGFTLSDKGRVTWVSLLGDRGNEYKWQKLSLFV